MTRTTEQQRINTRWTWEQVDEGRSGSSGDLSKLFRNEQIAQRGVLAIDEPPVDATVLAREVVQNSWDAARELSTQRAAEGVEPTRFDLEFRFREARADAVVVLSEALGLEELASRSRLVDRRRLGLNPTDCLTDVGAGAPIRLLEIREHGTTGMYGPFEGSRSKLYLSLVSVGLSSKIDGDGGSYGFGKAGLIRGSSTRTVVAYTCFEKRPDDPGVTRRLLGMTYWGMHETSEGAFSGFARMGRTVRSKTVPWENDDADTIAAELGLPLRDGAADDSHLGTTFLLLDPTLDPLGLLRAIERNWWPAIRDGVFGVRVVDVDGTVMMPRPLRDATLRPFVRAYELATRTQDNRLETEYARRFNRLTLASGRSVELGRVGLVADLDGWSYPPPIPAEAVETAVSHRSLVALVRGPRMVVDYLDGGSAPPYVRGVFVADDDVDDLLRQTEPKSHDSWEARDAEEGVDADAPVVARAVTARVRASVDDFRRQVRPPTVSHGEVSLPILQRLLSRLLEGRPVDGAERREGPRPTRTSITQHLEPVGDDQIRLVATVRCSLDDAVPIDAACVQVSARFVFVEEAATTIECGLNVLAPSGFVTGPEPGTVRGPIDRRDALIELRSAPYSADWSGRLVVQVDLVDEDAGAAA